MTGKSRFLACFYAAKNEYDAFKYFQNISLEKYFFMICCLKALENNAVILLESDKADEHLLYPFDLAKKFYAPLARHWTKSSNAPNFNIRV